jgi:hypothetical protein
LELRRLSLPQKTFLLSLLRSAKFSRENFLKVLQEFKSNLDHFYKDCFYCVATAVTADENDAVAAAALMKLATGSSHHKNLFRKSIANNKAL